MAQPRVLAGAGFSPALQRICQLRIGSRGGPAHRLIHNQISRNIRIMHASVRRSLIRLVVLSLLLSAFVSPLLCGQGFATAEQTAECCRAMQGQCQKRGTGASCCNDKPAAPAPVAVAPASVDVRLCPSPATISILPPPADVTFSSFTLQRRSRFSFGHSPPRDVPLFLYHSTLLI